MADQVGTANVSLVITTDKTGNNAPAPYNYNTGYGAWLSKGIVYGGYLYVCVRGYNTVSSGNTVGIAVMRIPLGNFSASWEVVSTGYLWTYQSQYFKHGTIGVLGNKFVLLDSSYGTWNQMYGQTAMFDVTNIAAGWESTIISDIGSISSFTAELNSMFHDDSYIYLGGGGTQAYTYGRNMILRIAKSNLNGSWGLTAASSVFFVDCIMVVYNNEVYLVSGRRHTDGSGTTYNTDYGQIGFRYNTAVTNKTLKYNGATNTWTDEVLPIIPTPVSASSAYSLVNNILYILAPGSNVYHYIDMSLGVNGAWTQIPLPPFTINTKSSLTFDGFNRRLIAIDTSGKPHFLRLCVDNKPAEEARWDDVDLGLVGTVITATPNIPFDITTKSQEVFAAQSNISFTITTYGYIITSMTNVNTPVIPFSFTSSAVGTVNEYVDNNIIGTTKAIPFVIGVSASEKASANVFVITAKTLPITLGSTGEGLVSGFGTVRDNTFKITSNGSGVVGVVSIGDTVIPFEIDVAASGYMPVEDSDTTLVAFVIDSLAKGVMKINGVTQYPPASVDAWSVNIRTGGHSQYTNYPFNGMFKLNGDYFGTSDRGLFKLDGDTDNGVVIEPVLVSGLTDFYTAKKKNINSTYIHMRVDDDVIAQFNTDEQVNRRGYRAKYDGTNGLHRRRLRSAKGIKGTNWQLQLTSEKATEFEVSQVDVDVVILGRTV